MKISPSQPTRPELSRRDRVLLIGSISVIGVCALFLGGLYLLSNPPQVLRPKPQAMWVHTASSQQLDAALAKGKWVRERFRKWATAHRADLLALRDAQPDDLETMQRVMRDLPDDPTQATVGFEAEDLELDPLNGYCWNIANHPDRLSENQRNDPQVQERQAKGKSTLDSIAARNWKERHDIALGFTTLVGPRHYTLWASGRITETTVPAYSETGDMLNATEKEVMPAFDL